MTVNDVCQWLDRLAPFETAESYDNVGLIVGDKGTQVKNVLFTVDVTPSVVSLAKARGCELIVSHHPLLFLPAKHILFDELEGATIKALCQAEISLISAHTNLDIASGGIGDSLAETLGLQSLRTAPDGIVRVGELETPMMPDELERFLTQRIGNQARCYAPLGQLSRITTLAIGVGAYSEGYEQALAVGAQAYLTGEIKHHDALPATYRGLTLYELGHYATERFGIEALEKTFRQQTQENGWQVGSTLSPIAPYFGATLAP